MNYKEVYAKLKKEGKIAFIPFTILGFPNYDTSLEIVNTMIDNGADVLELGFPFSDPVADGPIIQEANNITLEQGINTESCFQLLAEIRKISDIPIGLLIYANLIYAYGVEEFYAKLGELKINSVLIPDIPPEESDEYNQIAAKYGVQTVFIVTPITPEERIEKICKITTGFIYLISRLGVTGTHKSAKVDLKSTIQQIKKISDIPVNVGFGISKPEHLTNLKATGADGGIIGSAIIKLIQKYQDDLHEMKEELSAYLLSIAPVK